MAAMHREPVKGSKANFLIRADLDGDGMPGKSEQLWARKVDQNVFEICSIPFFPYGLALGDTVATNDQYTIKNVLKRAGHKTFRVAVANREKVSQIHEVIHGWLDSASYPYDWFTAGYVAVDLSPGREYEDLVGFVQGLAKDGDLSYEVDE